MSSYFYQFINHSWYAIFIDNEKTVFSFRRGSKTAVSFGINRDVPFLRDIQSTVFRFNSIKHRG